MDMDTKLAKKMEFLIEKREKHKAIIQAQTDQLKKINEEIDALEIKKNDRLMKTFFSDLQKEGLNITKSTIKELVSILKEKQSETISDCAVVETKAEDAFVPSVPEAFR